MADLIDHLVKSLLSDEELIKAIDPKKINMLLIHAKIAKNPKLSPEERFKSQQAMKDILLGSDPEAKITPSPAKPAKKEMLAPLMHGAPDENIMGMKHHPHLAEFGVTPKLWKQSNLDQRKAVLEHYHTKHLPSKGLAKSLDNIISLMAAIKEHTEE
jgi:hypothetical protein